MKIKTRLLIYNLIIIAVSAILILIIVAYGNITTRRILHPAIASGTESSDSGMLWPEGIMGEKFGVLKPMIGMKPKFGMVDPELEREVQKFGYRLVVESNLRQEIVRISMMILVAIAIVVILAVLLSRHLLKKIMLPITMLQAGAERVRNSDFSRSVIYENNDELLPVINNFNKMQEALKEKTERAQRYHEAELTMVNGITHDIRTPLTAIRGKIKGVIDGVTTTQEKQAEYLNSAYRRTEEIERLLNQLVQDFGTDAAKIGLARERVEMNRFITETIEQNPNVEQGNLELKYQALEYDVYCEIDKIQLRRVLDNLINNTVQHNENRVGLAAKITMETKGCDIEIQYSDNGRGVKDKNLERIFDEFFKEDQSRSQNKQSVGLGLAIARKIVEEHGGTIVARNQRSLTFIITLPTVDEQQERLNKTLKSGTTTKSRRATKEAMDTNKKTATAEEK